ncbi:MAG: histidine triad nucleotide-binding protein [Clostridia bacterium]|nr:histidine triad nucleotide-binding protein [Clostridia bacterium]
MSDCIFCKIANKEIPSQMVYEDDLVIAFKDIAPQADIHILVVPRKHLVNLSDMEEGDKELIGHIHYVASKIAREIGIAESGFRIVSNHNTDAGQVVFHLHFHILGGNSLGKFW